MDQKAMNIFVLDRDPLVAARSMCDQHVVKMIVESAQMLSTVSASNGGIAPYRPTHAGHPCTKWVAQSRANWDWLMTHAVELGVEYTRRYHRAHKTSAVLDELSAHGSKPEQGPLTQFAQAMPKCYRHCDVVTAYRDFYVGEKSKFARWNHCTPPPEWWLA